MNYANTRLSIKSIARLDSADFSDCVNTGYRWTLYSDGHVAAESVSCWQGSRSGQRYVTNAGYVDVSAINSEDVDQDAEALLTESVRGVLPENDSSFRQTRAGYMIK